MAEPQTSTFDLEDNAAAEPEFDPTAPDPQDKKPLSPARQAAIEKMQAGKRAALERKRQEREAAGDRNRGDQRVHETAGHGAVHDENLEMTATEVGEYDIDNEVTEWVRPSELEAPPARPGFVQRWIRIRLGQNRDTARLRKAMREGWRPVKASSMGHVADHSLPIIQHDSLGEGDYIGAEDLLLCEMPERVNRQRLAFYKRKQARQTGAVERQIKGVHRDEHIGFGSVRMKNVSTVRRGQGVARAVSPAEDDMLGL